MTTTNTQKAYKELSSYCVSLGMSNEQIEQIKKYIELLRSWNRKFNLTAITEILHVVSDHIKDSLEISHHIDFSTISGLADIGTGGGLPGIPLKILFPNLFVVLIEVNQKKVQFLNEVISQLDLKNIEVSSLDWRTFLRKTEYDIDLFIARASLKPLELIRMFQPGCRYNSSLLVYMASEKWTPEEKVAPYIKYEQEYIVDRKKRKLVFLEK